MADGSVANRREYERRVNRAVDHIGEHLDAELTLAALARVAAFSPFHSHRVFRARHRRHVRARVPILLPEIAARARAGHADNGRER